MRHGILSAVVVLLLACTSHAQQYRSTAQAMGTEFEFLVYDAVDSEDDFQSATLEHRIDPAREAVNALVQEISSWRETSVTSYLNRNAHVEAVRVSPQVLRLFVESARIAGLTGGAFDPTVGPLLQAWNIRDGGTVPNPDAIQRARKLVGMKNIRINEDASTIHYMREGVRVEWGAVGKGYALDLAAHELRKAGIDRALISAGTSTLLVLDAPPDQTGWPVNIRDQRGNPLELPPIFLSNAALSTSACYGDGDAPCDILDPRIGEPVPVAKSGTVIADSALEADALSTAMLVMREDEIARMFASRPDLRGLVITFDTGRVTRYNWKPQEGKQ